MSDDVTITVRVNNQTAAGFRDINGNLRTMDGRFAASANQMQRHGSAAQKTMVDLKASMLSLAPAAVPIAASLAPIAAHAGAAAVAVGAFGAAVIPQIGHLGEAAQAQEKYSQAVQQYGAHSKQAVAAQQQSAQTLAAMPKATQQAAGGFMVLRDQFKSFSDSTAKFTMVPVEHSFAVMGALLPKLKPMVEGTSTQLDRLMKVTAGGINTAAFDGLSKRFSDFANNSLKSATDGAIHFMRVLSEGNANGPLTEFMAYAKAQGPAVKELLSNLMQALGTIAQGAADAGPGLLTLVNAFAQLVAAVPPELVGNLMQVYAAFKLIKLAGAGIGGLAGGFTTLAAKVTALKAASAAAGGGLTGLKAAFMSLGVAARASLIVGAIAAVIVVAKNLSDMGKKAPPDVDRLTTSLTNLGRTGKASGEAARAFGKDFSGLADSLRLLSRPSNYDKVQSFLAGLVGMDSGWARRAKQDLDGVDQALANMVRGGKSKLAAEAFKDIAKAMEKQGLSSKELKGKLDSYKAALADQALEAKLTAESMGIFGDAAAATQTKLDAQKQSADGLKASIIALNEVNRSAYDAQIGFEAAIDNLSAAFKRNGATLDLHTSKGRDNATMMSQAAKSQDDMIAAGLAAGDSLATMTHRSDELRTKMLQLATEAFDGNKKKAQEYVNTLLGTPSDIKTLVELERQEAVSGLKDVQSAIKRTPHAHMIKVDTLNGAAIKALESVGLKTKQLPNGKTAVYTANGKALGSIAAVAAALKRLNGTKAITWTYHNVKTNYINSLAKSGQSVHDVVGATGGLYTGKAFRYADGGPVRGPGTGTSDDVPAPWLSNGEFVIKKASVDKYGEAFLQAINDGRFKGAGFASGGKVSKAQQRARAQAKAEADARHEAQSDLTISHFGHYAGYQRSEFGSALAKPDSIGSLVNSLNEWRRTIMKATHGSTESKLLKQLDSTGKSLLKYEKQLNSVTKNLEKAKDKLASLKDAASQLASSVKGNLISSANITRGASGEGPVTLSTIKSNMTASRDKVTAFATALKQLKSKGFSKSIIQQVAEAGIDGGGLETASALLQASASEVASINSTQAQIEKAAGSAGKTTADAVYKDAIKAQTKVVDKLTREQEKLRRSMDKLAKSMEKAIERAFGKKAAGGIVGAAASGGLRSGLTLVGEQGPELAQLPMGSRVWSNPDSRRKLAAEAPWASMMNTPHRQTSYAPPPVTTRQQVEVIFDFTRTGGHGNKVAEAMLALIRNTVRVRGGDVQQVLGASGGYIDSSGRRIRVQPGR